MKDKFEQFINEREGFEYHSIESMVAIQKEAQGYKKRIIEFESSKLLGIYSSSWDDNFLDELEALNAKEELIDEYSDLLHVTRISKLIDRVFEEMTVLQSKHEDSNHWGGNYLGYIKKYQKGNEILAYFSSGDSAELKPLILDSEKQADRWNEHLRRRLYNKKHPNSYLAKEEREQMEWFRDRRNKKL